MWFTFSKTESQGITKNLKSAGNLLENESPSKEILNIVFLQIFSFI